jgi:hypothetical protein
VVAARGNPGTAARRAVAIAALVVLAAATAVPPASGTPGLSPYGPDVPSSLGAVVLTPDLRDSYGFTDADGRLEVRAAASNRGGNLRMAFWKRTEQPTVDQQACVTWRRFGGPLAQAGIALRIRGLGRDVQAITVTNNIWSGARNGWNVHLWQLAYATFRTLGQVRLTESFGRTTFQQPPLPWRICARAVGRSFEFKAWSLHGNPPEPEWGDPVHGGSFLLPADWDRPGRPGVYVGHLHHGETTAFDGLSSAPLRLAGGDATGLRVRSLVSSLYPALVGPVEGGRGIWSDTLGSRALRTPHTS